VTICPVTALHKRDDGIVDFNSDRCIGCKSCLQACPYDALYIDPDTNTAAKCNFCTHRLEVGLQPSCVVVCPEQAIIAGDMDDPFSEISQLLDRQPVQVRKPEKETRPKLFYIEADEASLVPTRTEADGRGMWSRGAFVGTDGEAAPPKNGALSLPVLESPRRAYDVRPRAPAWGWQVAAYTWTKSIAAGAMLAVLAARVLAGPSAADGIAPTMGIIALIFLIATAGLLVGDLKRPDRFLYVLLRPQWRSWLVRGAYVLTLYGAVLTFWTIAHFLGTRVVAEVLLWPGTALAVLSAVYTAFLFAQAKGRDFWQNPLLSVHLLAHALLAGGALWLLADTFVGRALSSSPAPRFMIGALIFSLVSLFAEILTTPPTTDARLALDWIIRKPNGRWFWFGGVGVGHVLPLLLLGLGLGAATGTIGLLVLGGIFVIERLWVLAPQQIPLS
jgi:formate-dependent nitrite reductase membrane component NrfD/ferredoxin